MHDRDDLPSPPPPAREAPAAPGADAVLRLDTEDPGVPVPPELAARLGGAAHLGGPGSAEGSEDVRAAAAGYFGRRGLHTDPGRVVCAAGPDPLLFALLAAAPGDVVLPRPSRPRHAAQAAVLGRRVHRVPTPADCGGVPDPFALLEAVRRARAGGGDPRVLVLATPDDPTGTAAPPELLHEVCEAARALGLLVVSDESLRDLPHHLEAVPVSPAEMLPECTVVLTGPGAALGVPGWGFGMARFPAELDGLRRRTAEAAAAVGSAASAPVQDAMAYALTEPAPLREHTAACARLHGAVTEEVCHILRRAGLLCRPPQAGHTLYPDLSPAGDRLARQGVADAAALERLLRERHGLAVLGGHRLGDDPAALRVRLSTGALYGATAQERRAALHARDPLLVPHVAEALIRLDLVFTGLMDR